MKLYPHLASKLFGVPLMMESRAANALADAFNLVIVNGTGALPVGQADSASIKPASYASGYAAEKWKDKSFILTEGGVGILPVYGALVNRAGQISADCTEMLSYQRLSRKFDAMQADRDVKAILLEFDSPGGEVAGNFDLAAKWLASRSAKPLWAHANESAFSAGYSLASATSRVLTSRTGMVGSIGVIWMHVDQAAKLEKAGYKVTTFKSGQHKDDFSSYKGLSKEEIAWADEHVNQLADMFFAHVAQARSLDQSTIRDMQAAIFTAAEAKQNGLIDGVQTFADTVAELEQFVASGQTVFIPARTAAQANAAPIHPEQEPTMADPKDKPAATAAQPATPAPEAGASQPATAASPAEVKARIKAITGHEEAKGRETLAQHIAFETDMSVEAAVTLLKASAKQSAGTGLAAAMAGVPNPAVGNGEVETKAGVVINGASIFAKRQQAVAAARMAKQ